MTPTSTNPMMDAPSALLSAQDVERLLSDDSPESRTGLLTKIADSYNTELFKGRERDIAEQIFRLLMKDSVVRVRELLAHRLEQNPTAPRDIILHLAHDVESVATPVLTHSKVLSDADLVSIVEQSQGQDIGKLLAITKREQVSERVSEALVETKYAPVMTSLLSNQGAMISERALGRIADDFASDEDVIAALVHKPELPITLVERLISQVGAAVAKELRDTYNLSESQVAQGSTLAREDFMVRLLTHELSREEVEALVKQMANEDRLTPSIVMTALCRGQLMFFTVALAHFSGIPVVNATKLITDRGEHGFNGLYRKSGLPESMMDAVRLLLRSVQDMEEDSSIPGSMLYANRLAEMVIRHAGQKQVDYLPYFIALIRQNQHRSS